MAGKDPKKPGLGLDSSPARRAALKRLLSKLTAVTVDPRLVSQPK
jgi:hypothetical protein